MSVRCVLIGGGGHAKVVVDAAVSMGVSIARILDNDKSRWGTSIGGIAIDGGDELLAHVRDSGVEHFVVAVGSVGPGDRRQRLFEAAIDQGLTPLSIVHARAWCSPESRIGDGTVVLANAVINAGAVVGRNVIVNTSAIVEHDCVIGDHAHIASGACLAGSVQVGDSAYVGAGAAIRQGLSIGARAVVAMGAVVIADVEPGMAVGGVPARPIRLARDAEPIDRA